MILHTTLGVVTDSKGAFTLNNVPEDGSLVISFVGFKSSVIKPDFSSDMIIKMSRQTVVTDRVVINPAVQSPSAGVKIRSTSGKKPLVVVNGVVTDIDVDKINPDSIKSINVLKDNTATEKYGEKGRDGVIEITTKKALPGTTPAADVNAKHSSGNQNATQKKFVVVEEMPMFPGGDAELLKYIGANTIYPEVAKKNNIQGRVIVRFCVTSKGSVSKVNILKGVNPELDKEAIRVVNTLPAFKPGKQNGMPVDVDYMVPVEFKIQ